MDATAADFYISRTARLVDNPRISLALTADVATMPACVTFDPGMSSLFHPPASKCGPDTLLHRSSSVPFLDAKKIAAAFFSLQNQQQQQQQQLLTPPASPLPVAFSPFDDVPNEILDQIIGLVHDDDDRPIYDVLRTISACSLVSRQFHSVANNWLYRYVPISDPYKFTKVSIHTSLSSLLIPSSSS